MSGSADASTEAAEAAADDLAATKIIDINPPITFQAGTFASLTLREPKAREVRSAEAVLKGQIGPEQIRQYQIRLVQLVSEAPLPVIEALPIRKLTEAANYLQTFIEAGPATGGS